MANKNADELEEQPIVDEISQSASKYIHYTPSPKREGKRAVSSSVIASASASKKQQGGTVVRAAYSGEECPEFQLVVQKKSE